MQEKIIQYLHQNGGSAGSFELAVHVLKMSNIDGKTADLLISSIVKDSDVIHKTKDNQWHLKEQPAPKNPPPEWTLFTALPLKVQHWNQWRGFGYAVFGHEKIERTLCVPVNKKELASQLQSFINSITKTPLLVTGFGNHKTQLERCAEMAGNRLDGPCFSLRQLVQRLFPAEEINSIEAMSSALGLNSLSETDLATWLDFCIAQTEIVFAELNQAGMNTLDEISAFYAGELADVDFDQFCFDKDFLQSLPQLPGVYIMKDKAGNIIYVGKSKNLYQRIHSYFIKTPRVEAKCEKIRDALFDIEIIRTGSELEALLLEQDFIETAQPLINTAIQIHERKQRKKQRFEQLVILPAATKYHFNLYLLSPSAGFWQWTVHSHHFDPKALGEQIDKCLLRKEPVNKKQYEIATSWISMNEEQVTRIDLRKHSTTEVMNIIKNQLSNLQNNDEKIVQYR